MASLELIKEIKNANYEPDHRTLLIQITPVDFGSKLKNCKIMVGWSTVSITPSVVYKHIFLY